jgi:hypothetical protein
VRPDTITIIEDLTPLQWPPKEPKTPAEHVERTEARHKWEREERERKEARERQNAEAEAEHREREQRAAQQQKATQRAWADKRDTLQAELRVAEQAVSQARGNVDLSSVDAALESARALTLSMACERIREGAEERLAQHTRGPRKGMFAA